MPPPIGAENMFNNAKKCTAIYVTPSKMFSLSGPHDGGSTLAPLIKILAVCLTDFDGVCWSFACENQFYKQNGLSH